MMQNVISGTGSYIPKIKMKNEDFLTKEFYNEAQLKLPNSNEVIIKKFEAITGIAERRSFSTAKNRIMITLLLFVNYGINIHSCTHGSQHDDIT